MIGRIAGALILSVTVMWAVAAATAADQPPEQAGGHPCQGITNAYSHAADAALASLQTVADKLGCDLSGVQRVAKPGKADDSVDQQGDKADEQADETDEQGDEANEPDEDSGASGPDVQAKCDKITAKLAAAQAKPHGKSADAFQRQADHWGCATN